MARSVSRLERARREGARAAQREHLRLDTPMDQPVDVFGTIEKAGVWLMFQPLPRLFGAYKREDGTAGIIINSTHPVSLQRYTAAHEYGHHVLEHGESIDLEESITGMSGQVNEQEAAAQSFAADFLMPLQLVNQTLRRMGLPINPARLSSSDVYKFSLYLGASYAATITQLVALKKVSPALGGALRKQRPIAIKEALGGRRPAEPRSDIWIVEEPDSGRELTPHVNDEVHVLLSETPSSGYVWRVEGASSNARSRNDNVSNVELVRDDFELTDSLEEGMYGGTGLHRLVFKVIGAGSYNLRVAKSRPWQVKGPPTSVFETHLNALERPTGKADRGLSVHQKELLSAA
jgi:Zn-dependent peptidase ImmA (M78 family)/predicted secreted protein